MGQCDPGAGLLLGLSDIAVHLGEHVHTVAHWYWEGHPVDPLPSPDIVEDGQPFWMQHRVEGWLARQTSSTTWGEHPVLPVLVHILRANTGGLDERRRIRERTKTSLGELVRASQETDLFVLGENFSVLARLALGLELSAGGLVGIADRLARGGMWSAFSLEEEILTSETPVGVFCRGLRGVALRYSGPLAVSVAELAAVLRSPFLSGDADARAFWRISRLKACFTQGEGMSPVRVWNASWERTARMPARRSIFLA